jgi:hypothetical protein
MTASVSYLTIRAQVQSSSIMFLGPTRGQFERDAVDNVSYADLPACCALKC